MASRSRHRRSLPDRPQPEDVQALPATVPQGRGKGRRTKTGKKRLTWAALLKRTFKIDVLTCGRCGGPMTLIHVALSSLEIETTLIALGLSPRAPPIAPARQVGVSLAIGTRANLSPGPPTDTTQTASPSKTALLRFDTSDAPGSLLLETHPIPKDPVKNECPQRLLVISHEV